MEGCPKRSAWSVSVHAQVAATLFEGWQRVLTIQARPARPVQPLAPSTGRFHTRMWHRVPSAGWCKAPYVPAIAVNPMTQGAAGQAAALGAWVHAVYQPCHTRRQTWGNSKGCRAQPSSVKDCHAKRVWTLRVIAGRRHISLAPMRCASPPLSSWEAHLPLHLRPQRKEGTASTGLFSGSSLKTHSPALAAGPKGAQIVRN